MSTPNLEIGIIGGAKLALALAHVIASREEGGVNLFVPDPPRREQLLEHRHLREVLPELQRLHDGVELVEGLADLTQSSRLIFFVGAPEPFDHLVDQLGEVVDGSHQIVHAIHRLHGPSLSTTGTLLRQRTCCLQVGALAGSLRIEEILSGHTNAALVSSPFPALIERTVRAMRGTNLCILGDNDLLGLEYAATLVQIVAVAVGLAEAMHQGPAAQAMLLVHGMAEVRSLGIDLGGSARAFDGLAGLAKLLVGVRRGGGPNYEMGQLIAEGLTGQELLARAPAEAEGIRIVGQVARYAREHDKPMPLTTLMDSVCSGELPPQLFVKECVSLIVANYDRGGV